MAIRRLERNDIDDAKWDACVEASHVDHPYAHAWFLDAVSPSWQALVLNDYVAVMPLPLKNKLGVLVITQPYWVQQLGLFSRGGLEQSVVDEFFEKIPFPFRQININLFKCPRSGHYKLVEQPNYELELNAPYHELRKNYSQNAKRNVKKGQVEVVIGLCQSVNEFITFVSKHANFKSNSFILGKLRIVVQQSIDRGVGFIHKGVGLDGKTLAMVFFVQSSTRIVYHTAVCSPEGYRVSAHFVIVDDLIQKLSESNMVLDFEGSRIEGIARFFSGFGAIVKPYASIRPEISFSASLICKQIWHLITKYGG